MKTANPNPGLHPALQTRRWPARRRRLDECEYRHLSDGLGRPPGARAHHRYRDALFPTTCFRRADDRLCQAPATATRHYLDLLHLAAHHSQDQVEALRQPWLASGPPLRAAQVEARLPSGPGPTRRAGAWRLRVTPVDQAPVRAPAVGAPGRRGGGRMKTANPDPGLHPALQTRRWPARRRRLDECEYRHLSDGLGRPPGAPAHDRYRDAWFPTTCFRRADDRRCQAPATATRSYLDLLHLAAHHSQDQLEALRQPWRAGAGRRRVTPVDRRRYEPLRSARPVAAKAAA